MFALNCTELPGAAIDACGAGISLRGISVAAGMTEVMPKQCTLALKERNLAITEAFGKSS